MKNLQCLFPLVLLQLTVANVIQHEAFSSRSDVRDFHLNKEQLIYLTKFGYLNGKSVKSQAQAREAIENFQKFTSLPVTGIIDESTLKLMKTPRCSKPDIIKNEARFDTAPNGPWRKRHLKYYIVNVTESLDAVKVAELTKSALERWGKWGRLTFATADKDNADIVTFFARKEHGDGYPFDGPGSILAHAFYPGPGIGGDLHYDEDEIWTFAQSENYDGVDFYSITLHELGHSLGLAHSSVKSAVMFPYYSYRRVNSELDYDDMLGMYELYIKNPMDD